MLTPNCFRNSAIYEPILNLIADLESANISYQVDCFF